MTTIITGPDIAASSHAQRLQDDMAAIRVSFTWLGVRKTLSQRQKAQAAETFGAQGEYLSAGKKLLDTNYPAFRAVTSLRNRIGSLWKTTTLPFPEPGIRLIGRDRIDDFNAQMRQLKIELADAVDQLDVHYDELRDSARHRLGELFNSADYPASLQGLFDVQWDFPNVQAPDYLLRINPKLYEEECRRVRDRFQEAVRLAEQAFIDEFAKLVEHLSERLSGTDDGRPKVFRDTALGNLREFFNRFKQLNVGSSPQLDQLVETAQRALSGLAPQAVRDNEALRQRLANQMTSLQAGLDGLMVDQPRRRVLRLHTQTPTPHTSKEAV